MFLAWRAKKAGLELNHSQKSAIHDGNFYASMVGFGETYLNPFAIFLKGSNLQLSLVASLPPFFGALAQMFGLWLLQFVKSRRVLISWAVTSHAIVWLLIAGIPFYIGSGQSAVWILIFLASLCMASGGAGSPAWNSLIGDLVPTEIRGRYFGLRNLTMGIFTFVSITVGGQILDATTHFENTAIGFALVFIGASVARFVSLYWTKHYEDVPHETVNRNHYFSFWQFLRRAPKSNFAKFVFYVSIINGAVAFAGPFFTVFMLRDLKMSYTEFTVITVTSTVVQFLMMQYWGQITDRFGNRNVINLLGYGVTLAPVLWIFGNSFTYLILVQCFNGMVWAGFNLAAANFLFDAVAPAKRARCTAYQAVINGSCVLIGAAIGGNIVDLLPHQISLLGMAWHPFSPLYFMFGLSGVVRAVASVILLPKISDAKARRHVKRHELLFHITRIRPISGVSFGIITGEDTKPASGKE